MALLAGVTEVGINMEAVRKLWVSALTNKILNKKINCLLYLKRDGKKREENQQSNAYKLTDCKCTLLTI